MLHSKDIPSIDELKKYLSCPTKMVDHLLGLLSFFEFNRVQSSLYVVMDVEYKQYPVRLFFSRFGSRGKWHMILSTD